MRILLLNTQMEAGGAQKAMLELARGLQHRGHQVIVATMYDKGNFVAQFDRLYGLKIQDLQMKNGTGWGAKARGFARGLRRLRRLLRDERIEVVQTFSHYSNIMGPILAWSSGVPVRVSSQRMSLRGAKKWVALLDRLVANSALVQKMTAVSEGTRRFSIEEEGISPHKLVTIYNGVDVDRYDRPLDSVEREAAFHELGINENHKVVLTVARLHPQKGHRFLLEAIPQILRDQPQTHFLFVGDGELCEPLSSEIERRGLQDCVHLLGVRQDIPRLLSIADLFVLPSLWEGLPNSVLEAMAAGLPAVTTNVDGCPEVVVDGQTGILVPPAEAEDLAKAILKILDNSRLAAQMGAAAKERARSKFSVEQNINSYVHLYESLLPETRAN